MKKIIILSVLLVAVLGACSKKSDDAVQEQEEDQNTTLKIKKFVERNEINDYQYIIYFNEDGTIQKELDIRYLADENLRSYYRFEYDSQKKIKSIKLYSSDDEFIEDFVDFTYDNQGKIVSMLRKNGSGLGFLTTSFTYDGNKISFSEETTNKSGYVILDNQGRIIETQHDKSGLGNFRNHYLTYENNELKEIRDFIDVVYSYTEESTRNPLFRNFIDNPLQYMFESQNLYDIDFTVEAELLPFNISNMTSTLNGSSQVSRATTFSYNDANMPISANTIRNGTVLITKSFEYY